MCLYVQALTPAEQACVEQLVRSRDAVTYRHARVVLLSAQRQRVPQIARTTGLSERWVREVIHRFKEHGLASLPRKKAKGATPRCNEQARAALLELLRRPPTDFGIESAFWTGADLAAVAKGQGIVDQLSERTARREIRRAGYRWQQAKRWSKKEPQYERKKAPPAVGRTCADRRGVGAGV